MFDGDSGNRENASIYATAYKELDNPNYVRVIGTAPSKEAFLAVFSNPEYKKRIQESGAGKPELKFLEKV